MTVSDHSADTDRVIAIADRMAEALKTIHDKHPDIVTGIGAYEEWVRLIDGTSGA